MLKIFLKAALLLTLGLCAGTVLGAYKASTTQPDNMPPSATDASLMPSLPLGFISKQDSPRTTDNSTQLQPDSQEETTAEQPAELGATELGATETDESALDPEVMEAETGASAAPQIQAIAVPVKTQAADTSKADSQKNKRKKTTRKHNPSAAAKAATYVPAVVPVQTPLVQDKAPKNSPAPDKETSEPAMVAATGIPDVAIHQSEYTAPLPEKSEMDTLVDTTFSKAGDGDFIVDLFLRNNMIYQGMFCQMKNGRLFIPLNELFETISFPIEINEEGASGWFISETRKFNLDLKTGATESDGKKSVTPSEDYFQWDGDIYMEMDRLNHLFRLNMQLNVSLLALRMDPTQPLPMELAEARRNSRRINSAKNDLRYPLEDLDYAALALPHLGAKLRGGHTSSKTQTQNSASLSGLYRGDLLFMSTSIFGTVSHTNSDNGDESEISNLSITGERVFQDNPFLTKITAGDIIPTSTPMTSSGNLERGVRITNEKMFSSTVYDRKTFAGKALPGWEVELYRNNQLIGFQTIKEDGTYSFENVELNFGMNRIKLILYGTEGQEKVREEVINVASNLQAGDVKYDMSFSQQGIGVFDSDLSSVDAVGEAEQGTNRYKAAFDFGLGAGMQLRTGFTFDEKQYKDRTVGSIGISSGFEDYLAQLDARYSTFDSSVMLQGNLRGTIPSGQSVSVEAAYQLTNKYEESSLNNKIGGSIRDSSRIGDDTLLSYGGSIFRTSTENTQGKKNNYYTLSGDLNVNTGWGHISNSLSANIYEDADSKENNNISGATSAYKSFDKGSLRGVVSYGLDDSEGAHVKSLSTTGTFRPLDRTTTSLTVSKSLIGSKRLSVSNTWSYLLSDFSPYLTGTWSDDDSQSIYAGVSVDVDFDPDTFSPQINSGGKGSGASCLVYNDKNYNNIFDGADIPIEGARLSATQAYQQTYTNENGRALFYRLQSFKPTDISVDNESLKDPRMYSSKGMAVTPRVGHIYDLELPVHLCGTIEGYVYIIKDDEARGKSNVPVQLVGLDNKVAGEGWSESGGYFFVEKVLPGRYSLRINPEYLQHRSFNGTTVANLVITEQAETLSETMLFFGNADEVEILSEKFNTKFSVRDDVVLLADFDDLDTPTTETYRHPERIKLADLGIIKEKPIKQQDSTAIAEATPPAKTDQTVENEQVAAWAAPDETGQPVKTEQTAAWTATDKTAQPEETEQILAAPVPAKPAHQNYALAIDVFSSSKSALRAVEHYSKRYRDELGHHTLDLRKKGNSYMVVIKDIKNRDELYRLSKTFLCNPNIIELMSDG